MAKLSYQNVEVDPNEDLNIYRNICKMLRHCWFNVDRFPLVEDIAREMGYTERHITHLARVNNLPHRMKVVHEVKSYRCAK